MSHYVLKRHNPDLLDLRPTKVEQRKLRQTVEEREVALLRKRLKQAARPKPGTVPVPDSEDASAEQTPAAKRQADKFPKTFDKLPISLALAAALKQNDFTTMTEIQRAAIPHALCNRDVLGAAKTGSGKTLAFLIPALEKLYRSKHVPEYGLGAVIISPTRELALQIYGVVQQIGQRYPSLTAGVVTGGSGFREESRAIHSLTLLVATPGRLLQHLDESEIETNNLQVLVLDEADRLLDMGFKKQLNAILEHLPTKRQTLLFSATQTASVKQLARLSLNKPEFIWVHKESKHTTPEGLAQNFVICPVEEKINMLWSFLKKFKTQKVLVFLATKKQVVFYGHVFKKLRPGMPVEAIHGGMGGVKRTNIWKKFKNKERGLLITTDVASRGLDLTEVHWVIQVDCPMDVDTYVHRVGRTARYNKGGFAVLFLEPSQRKYVEKLEAARIPIEERAINLHLARSINGSIRDLVDDDDDIKDYAIKAIRNYLKQYFLASDKEIFDIANIDVRRFAESYGLDEMPEISVEPGRRVNKNERRFQERIQTILDAEEEQEPSEPKVNANWIRIPEPSEILPEDIPIDEFIDLIKPPDPSTYVPRHMQKGKKMDRKLRMLSLPNIADKEERDDDRWKPYDDALRPQRRAVRDMGEKSFFTDD